MARVLEVRDLAVGYGDEVVLDEIAFDVDRGQVFAILGGSGSGKSTLLRTLIGLQPPLSGRVHFTGIGPPALALTPPRFGVLFQSSALFGSWTLLQNVLLPLQKWTTLPADAAFAVAMGRLRLVGLDRYAHHLPSEVSGGMRKRAGIARALALDPPILFFDEPSAGLDPITAAEIDNVITKLNAVFGITMVVVTHDLPSAYSIASRICVLLDGKVKALGERDKVWHDPDPQLRAFIERRRPSEEQRGMDVITHLEI